MTKQLNIAVNVLLVVLILLALGWVWGAVNNWDEIESRPVRLAYIILDFLFVIPVGLAAIYGLRQGKSWGGTLFVFALGALLFDVAHGVFYLIWDNFFGVPLPLAFVMLAVLVAYTVYAIRALEQSKQQQPAP
jgi:hypothetical protein